MADFNRAIGYVLRNEDFGLTGRVVIDNDGGQVRYGVNSKSDITPPDFYTKDPAAALVDAKDIYHEQYWQRIHGDAFTSDEVAAKVLDMAVNMGVRQAAMLLQRALTAIGLPTGVDGAIGPQTICAANQANEDELLREIVAEASVFYCNLATTHPDDRQFIHGWLARAEKLPSFEANV